MHDSSRSPKGTPRSSLTPERGSGKGIGGKSKGKGGAMDPAGDPRQRDHTTGADEEVSEPEVADHTEHKENNILPEDESLCDYDVETGPLQQPANESSDAIMEDAIPTGNA